MPWLGFVPDKVFSAAPVAAARLADQLWGWLNHGYDPDSPTDWRDTVFF